MSGVFCQNPNPLDTTGAGLNCCPNLTVTGCTFINYGQPIRLGSGTRPISETGCTVNLTDVTIQGGGANQNTAIQVGAGAVLRATNLQISGLSGTVRGITVTNTGPGVIDNTRIEINGGRIISAGPAIQVDSTGPAFSPKGYVRGLDATGSNSNSWPLVGANGGNWNEIEVSDFQPKQSLFSTAYAGAEIIIIDNNCSALPSGSKNQKALLQIVPVADPNSPNGTFNLGDVTGTAPGRLVMQPHLTAVPVENNTKILVRRFPGGEWHEESRVYPVHGNTPD